MSSSELPRCNGRRYSVSNKKSLSYCLREVSNDLRKLWKEFLGKILLVECKDGKVVANFFSQDFYGRGKNHTDYIALESCFVSIYHIAKNANKSIAIPFKIGCGLAGGDWSKVYSLIEKYFKNTEVLCKIYKL